MKSSGTLFGSNAFLNTLTTMGPTGGSHLGDHKGPRDPPVGPTFRDQNSLKLCIDKLRLRWYGHVLRAKERTVCKVGFDLERPKGRTERWLGTPDADPKLAGIHPDQAHDRAKWRQRTNKADPAIKRNKR
ncbi:hypothetical protein Y032_0426g1260 [Ancylostoma ceylanicum]|uniref:Uncharacterized protein n=1 Tax=Ancylostoma ceylanicum TaxID=53326 RepID=A0A016X2K7_9BILA|nr:hypothetical protein Y032_0426g1260 [Ancylostoma ceylanicum]